MRWRVEDVLGVAGGAVVVVITVVTALAWIIP